MDYILLKKKLDEIQISAISIHEIFRVEFKRKFYCINFLLYRNFFNTLIQKYISLRKNKSRFCYFLFSLFLNFLDKILKKKIKREKKGGHKKKKRIQNIA